MSEVVRALACLLVTAWCTGPVGAQSSTVAVSHGTLPATLVADSVEVLPREIPRDVMKYRNMLIREVRVIWGEAEPLETFFGQVHQESRWQTDAKSKYASGLAQFTPDTARWIQGIYPADLGAVCPVATGCPEEPRWALRALVRYDDRLYRGIAGSAARRETWAFTLAGYNGGPGWVTRERGISPDPTHWYGATETTCLRRADFCAETRGYVHNILERWAPLYRRWLAR